MSKERRFSDEVRARLILEGQQRTVPCGFVPKREFDAAIEALDIANEQLAEERARRISLEDRLFALGAMNQPPCFCCGYNGPNYYQPNTHECAKRHHAAIDESRKDGEG